MCEEWFELNGYCKCLTFSAVFLFFPFRSDREYEYEYELHPKCL